MLGLLLSWPFHAGPHVLPAVVLDLGRQLGVAVEGTVHEDQVDVTPINRIVQVVGAHPQVHIGGAAHRDLHSFLDGLYDCIRDPESGPLPLFLPWQIGHLPSCADLSADPFRPAAGSAAALPAGRVSSARTTCPFPRNWQGFPTARKRASRWALLTWARRQPPWRNSSPASGPSLQNAVPRFCPAGNKGGLPTVHQMHAVHHRIAIHFCSTGGPFMVWNITRYARR